MHDCWNELCLCQTGRIALSINFLCDASPNVSCFPGEKIMDRTKKKKNNLLQSDWKFEISIQEINVKKKSLEMLWSMWPWSNLCLRFVFLASVVRISRLMAANTWSKLLFQSRIFSFGNCWCKIVPLAWSYWLPRNFLSDLCSLSSWGY